MKQKLQLVVSTLDLDEPQRFSASKLLAHLQGAGNWPEASIHDPSRQYPLMDIEFHGNVGFSVLCFARPSSIGYLAVSVAKLSEPTVLVCLGGQVIEKWPRELFLSSSQARAVVSHFLKSGAQLPAVHWVRLDKFQRKTVHPGGKGLIPLWQKLRQKPGFPLTSEAT